MKRAIIPLVVTCLLCGPARAIDEIVYFDRATNTPNAKIEGTIQEESPGGIKIKTAKDPVKLIPASDIVEVNYQPPRDLPRVDFRKPWRTEERALKAAKDDERRKLLQEAVAQYQELLPRLQEAKFVQRYVEFRSAQLRARLAEERFISEDDAIADLLRCRRACGDGWELVGVVKLLARLYESKRDLAAAERVYVELVGRANVPREAKREAELELVRYLVRARKHDQAEQKLAELRKELDKDDPLLPRLLVYTAECQIESNKPAEAEAPLKEALTATTEPALRGLACNTLGDVYRRTGRLEDAFWQYLWVDVLYTQDAEQHARALYHLSKLFNEVKKDSVRAQQCRERLLKDKTFAGMEYQKLAAGEK